MTRPNYLPSTYDIFIGIDVGKNSFSFTVEDEKDMMRSKTIPSNPEQFFCYIEKNYADKRILFAYEAGPTGYHLYDYLTAKNYDCLVVSPNAIPKASNERVKNNRIDSRKIAHYLKAGHLTSIRVPTGPYRELRHLVRIREIYATKRKVAKQRIKALLLYANLYPYIKDSDNKWSNRYIQSLKEIPSSDAVRIRLDMLLMDLDYARKQILSIHRQMRSFVKNQPDIHKNVQYLQSIPGIGFITATDILGKIGDPVNLKDLRELACFVGLTPTERSTGDVINQGSITHLGNKNLRRLLIESAWVAIRRDTELDQFFHRIKSRNNPKCASQIAITAVARKLTQRIYRVLKDQRNYTIH